MLAMKSCCRNCICFSVKKMLHDQRIGDLIILIRIFYKITQEVTEKPNQLPKGMQSAVPLHCLFDVVKYQRSRTAALIVDKFLQNREKYCLSSCPSVCPSEEALGLNKGSEGHPEGSESQPEGSEGQPQGSETKLRGSEGLAREVDCHTDGCRDKCRDGISTLSGKLLRFISFYTTTNLGTDEKQILQ